MTHKHVHDRRAGEPPANEPSWRFHTPIKWLVGEGHTADGTVHRFVFDENNKPILTQTIPPLDPETFAQEFKDAFEDMAPKKD